MKQQQRRAFRMVEIPMVMARCGTLVSPKKSDAASTRVTLRAASQGVQRRLGAHKKAACWKPCWTATPPSTLPVQCDESRRAAASGASFVEADVACPTQPQDLRGGRQIKFLQRYEGHAVGTPPELLPATAQAPGGAPAGQCRRPPQSAARTPGSACVANGQGVKAQMHWKWWHASRAAARVQPSSCRHR